MPAVCHQVWVVHKKGERDTALEKQFNSWHVVEFIMICFYHSTTVVSAETSSAGVVAHGTILEGYGCGHVIRVTRVARPTGATRLSFYSPAVVDLFCCLKEARGRWRDTRGGR